MDERAIEIVESQLRHLGLIDEAFDATEIAADLADRTALNATLQDLIESADASADPTIFDPRWDR